LEAILDCIAKRLSELDETEAKRLVTEALDKRVPAEDVLKALSRGMEIVGEKYEASEYFLSELIFAGNIVKDLTKLLGPHLTPNRVAREGRIVVGTVKGDIHDLGKNIFTFFARSAGFDVEDLGVDVSSDTFVEKVREVRPRIVGMSALMSTTQAAMDETVQALTRAGVRDNVKIILGGAIASKRYATEIGADEAVNDAVLGVQVCKKWLRGDLIST